MSERLSPKPVDAILLAGKDPGKDGFNGQHKFSIELGGRSVLSTVLDALDSASFVDRVICVGPVEKLQDEVCGRRKDYILVEERGSLWDNVSTGIEQQQKVRGDKEVFIVCSDLPFLTSQSVDWMVINSQRNANIQVPVVPQSVVQQLSPTYETYYWPMKEFAFKMGNNVFIDINRLSDDRLRTLLNDYRGSGSDNYMLMSLQRLTLLQKYGGNEAVYTTMINYASKLLQMRGFTGNRVPFSGFRNKADYERVMSKILGTKAEMLSVPFVDVVLDIDNPRRTGIFQRGYDKIWEVVRSQANVERGTLEGVK